MLKIIGEGFSTKKNLHFFMKKACKFVKEILLIIYKDSK